MQTRNLQCFVIDQLVATSIECAFDADSDLVTVSQAGHCIVKALTKVW